MGTINSAFGIISSALDADQKALSVVANNVANANTPGYTQERPNWSQNSPIEINGMSFGTGVTETGAISQRDRILQERLDQQQQLASASGARLTALDRIQALFTPVSGTETSLAGDIGSDITAFFNSFSSLEADPTNNALREQVLSSASMLAGDFSRAAKNLSAQQGSLDQEAGGIASQVNALTQAIAQLNLEIQSVSPDADAGLLEDQRQQDLSQLSQLICINQVRTENNGLSITTTSGQLLVSEGLSFSMTTGVVDGETHFFVGGADQTAQLTAGGGKLGGLLTARDVDIPAVMQSLDQMAYSISTAANAQNNAGVDLDGVSGTEEAPLNIFRDPTAGGITGSAAAMCVVMIDPRQVAAAGAGAGTGDNSNAVALAALGRQLIVNGQTPINYFSNFISTLGSKVSQVQTENTARNASVTQLQTQNNALSAVNLNDEASALSLLETSYQAASQVFSILNTIFAAALNLGVQTAVS